MRHSNTLNLSTELDTLNDYSNELTLLLSKARKAGVGNPDEKYREVVRLACKIDQRVKQSCEGKDNFLALTFYKYGLYQGVKNIQGNPIYLEAIDSHNGLSRQEWCDFISSLTEIRHSLSLFSLISLLYDRYQDFIHLSRLSKEDLQHLSPITELTFPGQEVTDYQLLPYIRKVMEKVCGCYGDHTDITEPSRKVLLQQHKSTIDRVFIERPMDFILTKDKVFLHDRYILKLDIFKIVEFLAEIGCVNYPTKQTFSMVGKVRQFIGDLQRCPDDFRLEFEKFVGDEMVANALKRLDQYAKNFEQYCDYYHYTEIGSQVNTALRSYKPYVNHRPSIITNLGEFSEEADQFTSGLTEEQKIFLSHVFCFQGVRDRGLSPVSVTHDFRECQFYNLSESPRLSNQRGQAPGMFVGPKPSEFEDVATERCCFPDDFNPLAGVMAIFGFGR